MTSGSTRMRRPDRRPSLPRRSRTLLGIGVMLAVLVLIPGAVRLASAASGKVISHAGEAGTVSGLPATSSQVTVGEPNSSSSYSGLKVAVNQTKNLVNQDISVSWTGGQQTVSGSPGDFNGDYLQIFECWGAPENVYPDDTGDPGPPPSQCEFGGESSTPTSSYPIQNIGYEYSRTLTQLGWPDYTSLQNCASTASTCSVTGYDNLYDDTKNQLIIQPFDAVDGTSVGQQYNPRYDQDPLNPLSFWQDPYFSFDTTNEVDFARTYAGGAGNQLFQVDTGLEAPGLGCGQDIEPTSGGGTTTPQCWLVVVPRSTAAQENPSGVQPGAVASSPLSPQAWANRIAIPLQFNAVGSSCAINAATEGIEGSELASEAVSSWQPALCGQSSSTSYSYLQNTDDQARSNLIDPTYGSVGMSVFSDPIDPSQTSSTNPVVYAPLTLSGVVVGFNIERVPIVTNGAQDPTEVPLEGTRVETINLTPRLVAKLLTESYKGQFEDLAVTKPGPSYDWVQNNPESLFDDPDFLQYNPEFAHLTSEQQGDTGTLLVEEASSDAASTLWKWVLADPEAEAWLAGTPYPQDPTSMQVNPVYSTNPAINPSGAGFGSPSPESFPKSDTYCESASGADEPPILSSNGSSTTARPLCILDWSPYAQSMKAAAQDASEANDQAKTTYTPTATSADSAWGSNGPQSPGTYVIMTVTDSASADLYGLQSASLSRAGDDADPTSRVFVTPDSASLLAGEQAMTKSSVPGVLQTDVSTTAPGAYPLSMLTYAAATPESLSTSDRSKYAAFIQYAGQAGQQPGEQPGDLPSGYVPLPADLETQALAAAATILNPPTEGTPTSSTTPSKSSTTTPQPSDDFSANSPETATAPTAGPMQVSMAKAKVRILGPVALSSLGTRGFPIGVLRWALPIALLVGLLAGTAGLVLKRLGRNPSAARPATGSSPITPDPT